MVVAEESRVIVFDLQLQQLRYFSIEDKIVQFAVDQYEEHLKLAIACKGSTVSLHTGITYSEYQRGEVTLRTFTKLFRHLEYMEND